MLADHGEPWQKHDMTPGEVSGIDPDDLVASFGTGANESMVGQQRCTHRTISPVLVEMDINSNDRCMRSISLLGTVASIGAKEVEVGYVPLPPTGEEQRRRRPPKKARSRSAGGLIETVEMRRARAALTPPPADGRRLR